MYGFAVAVRSTAQKKTRGERNAPERSGQEKGRAMAMIMFAILLIGGVIFTVLYFMFPARAHALCPLTSIATVEDCLSRFRDTPTKCAVVFFDPPAAVTNGIAGFIPNTLLNYTSSSPTRDPSVVYFEYTSTANVALVSTRASGSPARHENECCNFMTDAEATAVAAFLNNNAKSDGKIKCWEDQGRYWLVPVPTYYDPWFIAFGIIAIACFVSALFTGLYLLGTSSYMV